ncbi:MAG: hypothetical protein IJF56_09775 [Clostridia bacterium]|nr:hypothetical protein [Clostridia bacterium]
MRIRITGGAAPHFHLRLPNSLVLNAAAAHWLHNSLKDREVHLSRRQILALMRAARKYSRTHPDWVLVEVQEHDGTHVEVIL